MKTFIPILIALALGVGAVLVGRDLMQKYGMKNRQGGPLAAVVIASGDLEPGAQLGAGDLKVLQLPAASIPPTALRDMEKAVGRVLAVPLAKGQTLVESVLAPTDAGLGLQALVPDGLRAVTVQVNEHTGMAGLLMPGCRVDVLTTLTDTNSKQTVARTILQDIRISAIGRSLATRQEPDSMSGSSANKHIHVTLLVTPEQAEALDLASNKGQLRLVLRGGRDRTAVATSGMTISELIGQGLASALGGDVDPKDILKAVQLPEAARPAPTPPIAMAAPLRRSVYLIKGGQESVKTFSEADGDNLAVERDRSRRR